MTYRTTGTRRDAYRGVAKLGFLAGLLIVLPLTLAAQRAGTHQRGVRVGANVVPNSTEPQRSTSHYRSSCSLPSLRSEVG